MRFLRRKFWIVFLCAFFGLGFWVTFKLLSSSGQTAESEKVPLLQKLLAEPTPTPFFLQDITMPTFRLLQYTSKLGELTKYEDKASYTSYLTNYDSDGFRVNGLLTIPKTKEANVKFPAIVFVHGYIAPTIYKTTAKYVAYVDYLAKNGFVVFKIDLRGHGDSEGDPGGSYYASDYVNDVLNAYSALQNADFVDPANIGLWGHSMAGNVTFRSFVAKKNIPALAIWAGAGYTYSDLLEYRLNDQSYRPPSLSTDRARRRQQMRDVYGEFDPKHWFWKQVPATNYLDDVNGVLQIHHAVNDPVVSIEYSRNLMNVLDGTKIEHELFEYLSGGHNIENPAFNIAMSRTVDFFSKHLKN